MASSTTLELCRLLAGAAFLCSLAFAPAIGAQSAADRETARSQMEQGDAAAAKKDFAAALKAYQAADQIMGVPTTGLAVAKTQVELGALVEARDTALRVTRLPEQKRDPGVFRRAREEAQQLADSLANRIPSLTITVENAADAAKVYIDGKQLPRAQLGVARKLNPGKYVVVASAPGYAEARADVELAEGAHESVSLQLKPATTTGEQNQTATTAASPKRPMLVYIGFGVGAVGIAVGSVTGLMSLSKASSAKDQCSGDRCPPSAQDDIDSSKTLANISNVGFAVGLIGIGVGVYGLVSSGKSEQPTPSARLGSLRLEPRIDARGVGLAGAF